MHATLHDCPSDRRARCRTVARTDGDAFDRELRAVVLGYSVRPSGSAVAALVALHREGRARLGSTEIRHGVDLGEQAHVLARGRVGPFNHVWDVALLAPRRERVRQAL